MAYNPGVQDQRGQLLAQGIATAGQSVAQGMQAYQQNKLRNQAIQGENEALLKIFSSDPEMQKYAPEGLDKFMEKSLKGGGLSLKDNVQLNGLLNTTIKTKGVIQDQAAKRQEQELRKQAMEMQKIQMAELQRKNAILMEQQAQLERLKQFAGMAKTNGVLTSKAQAAAEEYANTPVAKARLELDRAGLDSGAESALQYLSITGRQGGVNYKTRREDDPTTGKTYEVTVDGNTGEEVSRGTIHQQPAPPEVPDPLVRDIFNDFAKDRTERVQPALASIRANKEIEKLLASEDGLVNPDQKSKDGKIISGAFAKPELLFKRAANALGAKYEEVANTQQLGAHIATNVANIIKAFGAGTGLSDADREYALKAAGGDITMDVEAIKRIIRINDIAAKSIPKAYNKSLDKAFPKDSTNKAYQLARARLELTEDLEEAAPTPSRAEPKPTSAAQSILEKYGIK